MSAKTEGTVVFDGLVEGHIPPGDESVARIREWTALAVKGGLPLQLEIEGDSFSLLADKSPVLARTLGADPSARVADTLTQLLTALPPGQRDGVFSTLRSVEYRPGSEVQTVYVVVANGRVENRERVVEAVTSAPAVRTKPSEHVKVAGVALLVLLGLFGVTSFFVDWKSIGQSLWHRVSPLSADAVEVDASAFDPWFTVKSKDVQSDSRVVALVLERKSDEAFAFAPAGDPRKDLLRLAMVRGYVRAEVFGEDGKFLGFEDLRIAGLRDAKTVEVRVSVPRDPRPRRILLVP